jgi:histidinol-phosphate aminotransferase
VGFAVARPDTIDEIAVYRPPGSVSVVSVGVATALLRDEEVLRERVTAIKDERARFGDALARAGWNVHPSLTNFVLVEFESAAEAERVAEGLLSRGLIPRTFPEGHPLAHGLRLTVRNRAEDDRLIEAAAELSKG